MTGTEKLLRELIALPSVNPAFLAPGDPRAGEQRVAGYLAAAAGRAGLDVSLEPVFPGRSNVLASMRPTGSPSQRIVLAPHMDTVGVSSEEQFRPVRRAHRLHGRGACDTKGSVAVMLAALIEVARTGRRPGSTEIVFAGLVDEESNQSGSRALVENGFKATLAIVGEPTRCRIVTAHKGDLWLELTTVGKAAHGARPELGRNAVHLMARIVDLIETTFAKNLRRRRHPVLGHATINVGSIRGGQQPNIVPDWCVISLDRRTLPGESDVGARRELLQFLRRHRLRASLVDTKTAPAPPLETDARLPLVHQFLRLARQRQPAGVDFFTDAGVLASGGIPSVVFGPGDIAQAHTPDEWIDVRELGEAQALLVRYLRSLP